MTAPNTPRSVLLAAADLVEPYGRWTRHELARDADGRSAAPTGPHARCWCVAGALQAVCGGAASGAYQDAMEWLMRAAGLTNVSGWNDAPGRTSAEVVALLRRAADLAETPNTPRRPALADGEE